MPDLYTPKQVSEILGISPSAIRLYCDRYAVHLSTEATTTPRKFTEADLRTLAFVAHSTAQGRTHDEILDTWADTFPTFEWEPPQRQEEPTAQMVPIADVIAMRALLQEAQRREQETKQEAQQQAESLRDEIRRLERELGQREGELSARQRTEAERAERLAKLEEEMARLRSQETQQRRPWWRRLFSSE